MTSREQSTPLVSPQESMHIRLDLPLDPSHCPLCQSLAEYLRRDDEATRSLHASLTTLLVEGPLRTNPYIPGVRHVVLNMLSGHASDYRMEVSSHATTEGE